jgi:hypothetical protein
MARISGVAVTTVSVAEIEALDGVTAGTVLASKAAVVSADKDIGDFRNLDVVNLDAGASGTAGTVDIFPTTASKGKIAISATASTGDTTTTITNAAQSATATMTIPDTNGSASFVMTTAAQTITGVKQINDINIGASGTVGAFDIFPTTASKGKLNILAADNTGDTTNTLTNAAQSATATWTIPDTNGSASFVMTAATQTIGGAKTFSSAIVPTAGVAAAGGFSVTPRCVHTGGNPAMISTDGTNLSAVVTEMYVAEVFIPANCTVTGAAVMWGDATNGNAKVALFDSAGTRVALSASTDVSAYNADSYGTRIAFSAPYAAVGPATYYVGVICDDNTNRLNTHTLGNFGAGKIESLVYATEAGYATITPPTTFTTGLGPIATLY